MHISISNKEVAMPYDYDGSTNEFRGSGVSPELQSLIDKVSGSFSGISRGRAATLQAGLGEKAMGIVGGIQQQGVQDAAALEKTKLGEAGALERTNIGIQPAMMEQKRKSTLFPTGSNIGGIGGETTPTTEAKLPTLMDIFNKRFGV